ncbi:MAG: hypothetical protein EOM06_11065, partial [Sphingobacteriia bacterium]|nr:hypothetical protein [Sphingobacteriia bacterium]
MKNLNALKTIVAVFLMIPAIMLCQVPDIKMNAKMKPGEPNNSKVSGKALLYEQLNNPSDEGINSQQYPDFPDYSCEGADDFIVPAGESWTIDSVVIFGFYSAGGGVAGVGNVHFFQNDPATNLPGVAVNEYNNIVVNSNLSGDLTIVFTSSAKEEPPVLAEGQYWMSVQVNMSYTESGQWYWRKQLAPTLLNELAWRNPGGGFGVPGSESWLAGSLALPGSIHHNLSFGLHGTTASVGGDLIFAGQDLWTVPCGTFRFGETGDYPPLPADFFGPGSEPFEGTISLIGENSNGSQNPVEDLIVQRLEEAEFLEPYPFDVNVPIEIIQLALKSETPAQVSYPGYADSFFDVYFIINFEQPALGSDLITKEHDFGGTFTKEFGFYPFITFVDVDDPSNQFVFDPFTLGYSQLNYNSSDFYEWTLSPISGEFDPVGNDPLVLFSAAGSYLQIIPLLRRMDHAWLDMSENGQPLVWEGTGYANGEWFYYPNTEWWNVWFYDHPIAPERRKIINGIIMIEPRLPDLPSYVEIVFNWSTPEWPGFPEIDRPPLPSDVTDPQIEQMMIVRSEPLFVFQGNIFEPIQIPVPFEIMEYNPEWLSIDLRGYNFILIADIDHTCWIEGDCTEFGNLDYGDAPEGSLAYTNGVNGQFPTCMNAGAPGSYISHVQPSGLFFGGMVDTEGDGNAGTCPMFHPNNYNVDECGTYPYSTPPSSLLDEGLMYPASYTIVGTSGNEQYVSCSQQTLPLGSPCGIAVWGQDIDIWVDASQSQGGYLNVLFDWDQNGVWMGASSCQPPVNPNDYVPEHAVQNLLIPAGFVGPVSQLSPPNAFQIGPNTGYVWARFSLTDQQVALEWDGAGVYETGETEDYLIEISGSAQDNLDFGDNPDPNYPTLLANDGARHVIDGITFLGLTVDSEPDGQPDPNAKGDDNNGVFDEDGVFWGLSMPGSSAQIHVITSVAGFLQGWIDFNADGDWNDAGEQIFTDEFIHFGSSVCLNYFVPSDAMIGNTFARFRFSTQGGLTFTGLAPDGEVEDYLMEIIENPDLKWLQEPCEYLSGMHCHDYTIQGIYTYPALADDWICGGGAVTKIQWWGNYEEDQLGNELRYEGIDHFHLSIHDHDPQTCLPVDPEIWGVDVPFNTLTEQFTGITNSGGSNIYLYEYILPEPFNQIEGNHYWLDITAVSVNPLAAPIWRWQESDRSISTVLCPAAKKSNFSPWSHISWVSPQPTRFSEMAFALVSEYIQPDELDCGDAPDQPYPTLLANDGARHIINPNIYMGSLIDAENDGQPTSAADGDDLNNLDDEDGVTFTKPLVVGKQAFIKVKTSVSGYLNAWIDFNQNGTWADAGDQIFLDIPLVAGINNLNFAVPAGIKPGSTYSRFRFNTVGGLTYYGLADDGEVEDYHLIIHPPDWGFIPSANTHLIAIPASVIFNCISLVNEDFIGTFYTNDGGDLACGGAIMWDGINNQAVIAYGDDVTTTEKDGFYETEVFTWKVYHSASGNEETVSVFYDPLLPDYDGKFHSNGLSGLTSINKPLIITATANPDTICAGDPVQLDVVVTGGCGPLSYSWTSVPAGFTSSVKNPVVLPVVTTTYYVTVSTSYGDSKTSSVQVIVYPLPQMDCPPFMNACEDDPPVLLNNSYPLGGVYNGTGVYYDGVHY